MDINEILDGAKTAFIDESLDSNIDFRPKLLSNNEDSKVSSAIRDELVKCDEFFISAAFIKSGAVTSFKNEFKLLEKNNIKGKILTTDYFYLTEPKALRMLQEFDNLEIRLFSSEKECFHTKGYIFKKGEIYTGIVGSSNMKR